MGNTVHITKYPEPIVEDTGKTLTDYLLSIARADDERRKLPDGYQNALPPITLDGLDWEILIVLRKPFHAHR